MLRTTLTALALAAVAATAQASPLEPLWQVPYKGNCEYATVVRWRDQLIVAEGRQLTRLDAATGRPAAATAKGELAQPPAAPASVPSIGWSDDHPGARFVVGDVILGTDGKGWVAYDAATGAALWRQDEQAGDAGLPDARPAGDGVLLVRPGAKARGSIVALLDPKTGAARWHVETAREMRAWIGRDDARVYVATTPAIGAPRGHLAAYALATGKRLWAIELAPPVNPAISNSEAQDIADADAEQPDVIAIDGGRLVLPVPGEGLRLYDAATGREIARIAAPELHRFGITGLVATGGRAFFFVRKASDGAPDGVEAIDLAAGKLAWRRDLELGAWGLLRVDPALTVETDGLFRALDPATGDVVAEWGRAGLATSFARRAAGAPALVLCGDGKLTALDPSGTITPAERVTIDGTLACVHCRKGTNPFAGVRVTIGAAAATTDRRGHFRIATAGRGVLPVTVELPALDEGRRWSGPSPRVVLSGRRAYHLGRLAFEPVEDDSDE